MLNRNLPPHPIFTAAEHGDLPSLSVVLHYQLDLNIRDAENNTALILAAANNHIAAMRMLLNHGASVEAAGNNGYTALNVAAYRGCIEAAELLIAHGASLESRALAATPTGAGGPTPLWSAVENGHEYMVDFLIAARANVNVEDANGNHLLSYAISMGNPRIIGLLLIAHANPEQALQRAANRGRYDLVRLLQMDKSEWVRLMFGGAPVVQAAVPSIQPEIADDDELDLPAWCLCPISLEIMKDPITVRNGQTYERASLRDYFASKGNPPQIDDPKTRDPIYIEELTNGTNIALREAIQERIAMHEQQAKQAQAAEDVITASSEIEQTRAARLRFFGQGKSGEQNIPKKGESAHNHLIVPRSLSMW